MLYCSTPLLSSSFLLLLLPIALASEPSAPLSSNGTTVYELLPKFGLPEGLLPDTVESYSLAANGRFEVVLRDTCYIQFEYLVYYDSRISGTIKYGGIEDLKGIQVKRFLLWFDVDSIKVDLPPSDYVYFQVGWITKKLQVDQFKTVHSCTKNLLLDEIKGTTKSLFKLPEPVREITMLITE